MPKKKKSGRRNPPPGKKGHKMPPSVKKKISLGVDRAIKAKRTRKRNEPRRRGDLKGKRV